MAATQDGAAGLRAGVARALTLENSNVLFKIMRDPNDASGHGGARPGAGRPPAEVKNEAHQVRLPLWAVAMLRRLGDGSISRGIVAALEKLKQRE